MTNGRRQSAQYLYWTRCPSSLEPLLEQRKLGRGTLFPIAAFG